MFICNAFKKSEHRVRIIFCLIAFPDNCSSEWNMFVAVHICQFTCSAVAAMRDGWSKQKWNAEVLSERC